MSEPLRVLNIFDVLAAGKLERCQECRKLKEPTDDHVVLLVSHRWQTPEQPDMNGIQYHGILRFVIQACQMAMGSTPNVFNCVDSAEIELCPVLLQRLQSLYQNYVREVKRGEANAVALARRHFHEAQALLKYLKDTIGPENAKIVGTDILALAFMMHHCDVWYDYACMPQAPRTAEEQAQFDVELRHLETHFSHYYTVIIWSASSIKRAWCFLEAAVSAKAGKHSIFCSENSKLSSREPSKIEQLFHEPLSLTIGDKKTELGELNETERKRIERKEAIEKAILHQFGREKEKVAIDLTTELTTVLAKTVHQIACELQGKDQDQILVYLESNSFDCTDRQYMPVIAKTLAAHYRLRYRADVTESGGHSEAARAKLYKAYLSNPNSQGIQWAIIAAETTPDRRIEFVWMVFDDNVGLRSWRGRINDPVDKPEFLEFMKQLEHDTPNGMIAEGDISFIGPLVTAAIRRASPSEKDIGPWRHILQCASQVGEMAGLTEFNLLREDAQRRCSELLPRTPELLVTHRFFHEWVFRAVTKGDVSTEVVYINLDDCTPERAIELWVTPRYRKALEERLVSCAYVLFRRGHSEHALWCLVAAMSVVTEMPVLTANPFLRAMACRSLERARAGQW